MARARASETPAREWPPVSYWLKVAAGVIVLIALAKAIVILRQVLILMGVSMILAIGFQPTIAWFERNLIASVPWRYAGACRRVYPGFLQVAAFMSMNLERHVSAHRKLFTDLARNDRASALATAAFYDEYFAVLDLTAEFYLETVQKVFQQYELPLGALEWQGRRVEPAAIRRTALLTVEGERDDICAVGQTVAAHDLCPNIGPAKRGHHLQAGVGHYGVFNGRRWESQIYPILQNFIRAND